MFMKTLTVQSSLHAADGVGGWQGYLTVTRSVQTLRYASAYPASLLYKEEGVCAFNFRGVVGRG